MKFESEVVEVADAQVAVEVFFERFCKMGPQDFAQAIDYDTQQSERILMKEVNPYEE